MAEKMMLIDGNSIVNRAFYGVPLLSNGQGQYTNAVYGFLNILFKLLEEEKPQYLGVAFDLKGPTFRHKEFEAYKGTRKGMPDELASQMPLLKEVLSAMGIAQFSEEGFEADDILGTLSKQAEENGLIPIVVSGDRDLLQLASETLKVKIPKTYRGQTTVEDYYAKDVLEKYGVTPQEFIDLKGLMGDASDNIPGVPGIGEKTAAKIIQQYHTVEQAIENAVEIKPKKASENLIAYQDQARLSKHLATIVRNAPVSYTLERMSTDCLLTKEAYDLFKKLDFKSLLPLFDRGTWEREESDNRQEQTNGYRKITEPDEATAFLKALGEKLEFSYILIEEEGEIKGIGFYDDEQHGLWIETGEALSQTFLVEQLKPLLESQQIGKIVHDGKKDIRIFRRFGLELNHIVFDTAIAAYLLNSTKDQYEYNDIAAEYFNEILPSAEELLGKGKSRRSVSSLEEPERTSYVVKQAEVMFRARKVMEEKLKDTDQEYLFYQVEMPLLYVLADMEWYGMKIDKEALLAYQRDLENSIDTITKEIYQLAGEEFNINSPKQLGVILFEKFGLPGGKKTKTGYSTAADVLDKLRGESPLVDKILVYRQLAKLKSTYADGLLHVMNPDTQKIYSTFNQTITATGRISSTEPNLQNIPIRLELGRELRKVFVPTDDNFVFLDADYSQIELRVLAHMAGDETLIQAFQTGQDIHRLTASQVFHTPFEEVTPQQRNNAKAVNFGIVYGIGAFRLSQDLGITRKEADSYIAGYFAKYPKIKEYMDKTIADARKAGYVSTIFHRRRLMPELESKNFNLRSFGERVAMNMPIQGSAADIIKIAMVRVHRSLKEAGLRSRLILQVHDELLIEAHKEEVEQVTALLKYHMENAASLRVPLIVDIHVGENWFKAK